MTLCPVPNCNQPPTGEKGVPLCGPHWSLVPERIRTLLLTQSRSTHMDTYPYLMVLSAAITAVLLRKNDGNNV